MLFLGIYPFFHEWGIFLQKTAFPVDPSEERMPSSNDSEWS